MTYAHNAEADFAASELARMFAADATLCYAGVESPPRISTSATYEPSASGWPKADGLVLVLESPTQTRRGIAVEYKRPEEGLHGVLTGIGQTHGYVHKGYNGAVLVLPQRYATHDSPAEYVHAVLKAVADDERVGVFKYQAPDLSSSTPFANRLICVRPLRLGEGSDSVTIGLSSTQTQWVHMREGSTTRDAFYRFLQTAKRLSANGRSSTAPFPKALTAAVARVAPGVDPKLYLSSTTDDRLLSKVWRDFWFEWLATPEVLTPFVHMGGTYTVPGALTSIERDDGAGLSEMFEGRVSSLKNVLVAQLIAGTIDEPSAWDVFVGGTSRGGTSISGSAKRTQGVRDRAHSYREDLDSALSHLDWLDADGRPTDFGYRFVSICERYGGANSEAAKDYLGATLVQTGHYGAFLHYVHRLSEEIFSADPLAFCEIQDKLPAFTEASYWNYLSRIEDELANKLKVMRKAAARSADRPRTQFQAELTLLRRYGFVSGKRYRMAVGIPIDWVRVQQAMATELWGRPRMSRRVPAPPSVGSLHRIRCSRTTSGRAPRTNET